MRRCFTQSLIALLALLPACTGVEETSDLPAASSAEALELSREPIQVLATPGAADGRIVALGRRLFHDARFSKNNKISCSSCHDLATGGDDGKAHSSGADGQDSAVNAPTVFNAALNFAQFWDGRAATLEQQVNGPVENPLEMASGWPQVLTKLRQDEALVAEFGDVFVDGLNENSIRTAIATFERQLVTVGSPFDRFLAGDATAIDAAAKAGYEAFKALGCIACHQGANVGGNMYQKLGVFGNYFEERGNVTDADLGRYNVTKRDEDRFVFRVPSLRYVAHTAPYFHDGSRETLEAAVRTMARVQLGRDLEAEQVSDLIAFLTSLAGPVPEVAHERALSKP